ncbi:MAG TPA: mechanosensitive ion channel [Burkholderiales bacterium]|jgi:miniconductance mechanosensitive channel|nr:mechanosensitive ion channel [Burkholderiales bacterium]
MPDMVSNSFLGWVTDANLKIIFSSIIIFFLITAVAVGVDYLIRKTIIYALNRKLHFSKLKLLQLIEEHHVLDSLALLVFGLVFVFGSFLLVEGNKALTLSIANFTLKAANLFNLYILTVSLNRFISALHEYYQSTSERDDKSSWHSYIKIISFFSWLGVAILAIAYIYGQPPASILTGLGALSAIILLIFRDTFLGIVASIQANATSMVRIGDSIIIKKYDIEGTVEEISIHSVRIRNFDNSVTTLPTYTLTTEAVQNMEYVTYSEGKRFKQAIAIAPDSVKFINNKLIDIVANKYSDFYGNLDADATDLAQVTNLSLLRMLIQYILQNHPYLNQSYTNIAKINATASDGVAIEITGYTFETSSREHEEIKASIIGLSYAMLAEFELRAREIIL